jgi:hypothetical protein
MGSSNFSSSGFIRAGGAVSFEDRAAQPSDFNSDNGMSYAQEYAESPTTFNETYPNWQAYADCFVMRRPIVTITGTQTCKTSSFLASEMKKYIQTGETTVKDFIVPEVISGDTMPSGKYHNVGMTFADNKNGYSEISISYMQYGEWDLVKIEDDLPDPTKK